MVDRREALKIASQIDGLSPPAQLRVAATLLEKSKDTQDIELLKIVHSILKLIECDVRHMLKLMDLSVNG